MMDQRTKNASLRLIGIMGASVLGLAAGTFAKVFVSESLYFERNTPLYFMLMNSSLIERIPSGGAEAKYYWSGGDGPKSPALGVQIASDNFPLVPVRVLTDSLRNCISLEGIENLESIKDLRAGEKASLEIKCGDEQVWVTINHGDKWHLFITVTKISVSAIR